MNTIKRALPAVAIVLLATLCLRAYATEIAAAAYKFTAVGGQYLQTASDLSRAEDPEAAVGAGLRALRTTKRGVLAEGGFVDDTATTPLRSAVHSPADPTTITGVTSSTTYRYEVKGRASIYIAAHFSQSSETCVVTPVYAFLSDDAPNTIRYERGPSVTLSGGSSFTDASGLYMSVYTPIDGSGAKYVYPVITTMPATGTVSLTVGGP